jgi:hypothetical protein
VAKKVWTKVLDITQQARAGNKHARGRLHVDANDVSGQGMLKISGWVLGASSRATEVEVLVGESLVGRAKVGIHRPGVAERFPEIPHAAKSGFKLTLVPQTSGGESELLIRAVLENGVRVPIGTIRAKVSRRRALWRLRRG